MRFSVLMPVYNTEKYLETSIQSVLNQTYCDFEIIIVDDGSTDSSAAICDKYQADYPEIVKVIHKENQGLISARRVGIKNATGDYCIFLDSDDYICSNLLMSLETVLSNDNSIDLLIYSFKYVQSGRTVKTYPRFAEDGVIWTESNRKELIEKLLYTNDITPIWIKAVKTALLKLDDTSYEKFYKKNMAEDYLQSLFLITYAQKTAYYYFPLYCYNYNDTSISRDYSYSAIAKQNKKHVYYVLMDYLVKWKMNKPEFVQRINGRWFDDTMYLFFKCYENAKGNSDRHNILQYDWNDMLPNTNVASYTDYVIKDYHTVYRWWCEKKQYRMYFFFLKRKINKKLRKIKRSVIRKKYE